MLNHIIVAKERIFECFDIKLTIAKSKENRKKKAVKQKKSAYQEWQEFKTELTQYKQALFLTMLKKRTSLITINIAIWLANIINSVDFFSRYSKVIDIAFWIVNSSFYLVPATPVILFILALLLILCVATAKLKNKMEKTGVNITNRKLSLILINYYCSMFLMFFFTTFILSQAIHAFHTVNWVPVFTLVIGYNLFLMLYSSFGAFAVVAFDHLVTKFCDYIINDVNTPDEITV